MLHIVTMETHDRPAEPQKRAHATAEPEVISRTRVTATDSSDCITLNDVYGLRRAKCRLKESAVLPLRFPMLFKGYRSFNIILFGPKGCGKKMITKAVLSEIPGGSLYIVKASDLFYNDEEPDLNLRAIFLNAYENAPSIIFFDDLNKIFQGTESEALRKLRTEFLVQLDSNTMRKKETRTVMVGSTSNPLELNRAICRRVTKYIYIPLPNQPARLSILKQDLEQPNNLNTSFLQSFAGKSVGLTCSELKSLCYKISEYSRERAVLHCNTSSQGENVRIEPEDCTKALDEFVSSVSDKTMQGYYEFAERKGLEEQIFEENVWQPSSLQQLCKNKIKGTIGYYEKIEKYERLPLPKKLINCITTPR